MSEHATRCDWDDLRRPGDSSLRLATAQIYQFKEEEEENEKGQSARKDVRPFRAFDFPSIGFRARARARENDHR